MAIISSKNEKPDHGYFAFFDLDRTITREVSGKAMAVTAFKKGLMNTSDLMRALYLSLSYELSLKDPLKIIASMATWIKGLPEKSIVDLSSEVFREVLLPSVYDNARNEIKIHKERNAKIVILSSSITPLCREAARYLGMDDIICTDLEVVNGYYTGNPVGSFCFGEEKGVRLKEYCKENDSDPSTAWFFGDSIHDISALETVGHPVCVNPDRHLRKIAEKNGWDIKYWQKIY